MNGGDFPRVLAAETVSTFGSLLSRVTIPWLAALALQATPAQMALLLVADVLAGTLGALLLGPWVDRHGKRAAMLLADAGRLVLMAALALAVWRGQVTFAALVAVAAANGVLGMVFELARSAWTAHHVAAPELPRRNAQLSLAGSLAETAAFALGGFLYQGLGAAVAFAVDAASYAVSALCLRGVAEAPPPPAQAAQAAGGHPTAVHPAGMHPAAVHPAGMHPAGMHPAAVHAPAGQPAAGLSGVVRPAAARDRLRGFVGDAAAGLRAVAADPRLRALAGIEALGSFAFALVATVYAIYVTRELGVSPAQAGVVAAFGGAGAALGAVLAPRLGAALGGGRAMAVGLTLYALGTACLPLAGGPGWAVFAWLVAQQIVGDAGHVLHDVHDRTLRQTAAAPAQRARVDAGIRAAGQLALLAGAAVGGALGGAAGSRPVLWLAVAAAAAAALLAARRLARGATAVTAPG